VIQHRLHIKALCWVHLQHLTEQILRCSGDACEHFSAMKLVGFRRPMVYQGSRRVGTDEYETIIVGRRLFEGQRSCQEHEEKNTARPNVGFEPAERAGFCVYLRRHVGVSTSASLGDRLFVSLQDGTEIDDLREARVSAGQHHVLALHIAMEQVSLSLKVAHPLHDVPEALFHRWRVAS
jgi:hypothetical protein